MQVIFKNTFQKLRNQRLFFRQNVFKNFYLEFVKKKRKL